MLKDKKEFEGKDSAQIWEMFGGEMVRGNVSRVIRELSLIGFTTGQISKMLGKRYQHVRNVLKEPLKRD